MIRDGDIFARFFESNVSYALGINRTCLLPIRCHRVGDPAYGTQDNGSNEWPRKQRLVGVGQFRNPFRIYASRETPVSSRPHFRFPIADF